MEDVREPALLARSESNALLAPSSVDARLLNAFDRVAFENAAGFDAIDPSPVCALGASHALGGTSQNNVLTTIRNSEALGDQTMALAIECARRKRGARQPSPVKLCASHRVIRLQPFDVPGFSPHFRLFALVTAGRDSGSLRFEMEHLTEHVSFYLRLCRALSSQGFRLENPLVEISDVRATAAALSGAGVSPADVREAIRAHDPGAAARFLAERNVSLGTEAPEPAADLARLAREVFEPLRSWYPEAEFRTTLSRLEGLGYYSTFTLRISPRAPDGARYPVIDGGFTDWTARLLGHRKERLIISGIGTEFVCKRFFVHTC